jgi:hypothetical protein
MFISGHLWRCTFAAALSSANREVAVTRAYAASMHQLLRVVPWVAGGTFAGLLLVAGLLHLFPRLGRAGRRVAEACTRAPGLDGLVVYFTVLPLIVGATVGGWAGLAGAVIGQVAAVLAWSRLHELFNRDAARGPRIVKSLNRIVGRGRNHAALWVTAIVTPGFTLVRAAEVVCYPLLHRLVGLPKYNHAEWVNVSRQKFEGLVGHDLIWCLYCDWMTGVWSLGTEMLRNVESFWCPIRFYNGKKCENCAIDFPDVNGGWVPADGTMSEVAQTIERMYGDGDRRWFEKRVQISVRGREIPV